MISLDLYLDIYNEINVKSTTVSGSKTTFVIFVKDGFEKDWAEMAKTILLADPKVHICRQYILVKDSLAYRWTVTCDTKFLKLKKFEDYREEIQVKRPKGKRAGISKELTPGLWEIEEARKRGAKIKLPAPRTPPPALADPPSDGREFKMKTTRRELEGGKFEIIEELPIPHVNRFADIPKLMTGAKLLQDQ